MQNRRKTHRSIGGSRSEGGFTLVVALLLLVALTFVGISALRNVTFQQKMTNNAYFRAVSFNEANGTLRLAQQEMLDLYGTTSSKFVGCSNADAKNLCSLDGGGSPAALGNDVAWTNSFAAATPMNVGFSSNWMNENVTENAVTLAPGCSVVDGQISDKKETPCRRTYMRQTSRSVDAVTGAISVTQQYFSFKGGSDENN
jgi:Tfp pilus assembly protein PilX